jgi:outer membrane lipoprotein-sorting protein
MNDFDGVDVYKLRLTNSKGDMVYYYIDATSNFILKAEEKVRLAEKEETNITVYSDFRKTSYGIYYPYTMQTLDDEGNESGGPIELSKVEFNVAIDASQFDASTKK